MRRSRRRRAERGAGVLRGGLDRHGFADSVRFDGAWLVTGLGHCLGAKAARQERWTQRCAAETVRPCEHPLAKRTLRTDEPAAGRRAARPPWSTCRQLGLRSSHPSPTWHADGARGADGRGAEPSPPRPWHFVRAQQPVPPPAGRKQPGTRHGDGRRISRSRPRAEAPPLEPAPRGRRIQPHGCSTTQVSPRVQQHVGEGVPHLARRAKNAAW